MSFALLWIGVYGLFLSTWEPSTLCYRITDIIPWGILLAVGLKTWNEPVRIWATSLFLVSTLGLTLYSRILPMHQAELNPVYQETLSLSRMTPPQSLYLTRGGPLWIYLLYFTGRTAWNAGAFEPERLQEEITRQKKVRPVFDLRGNTWQRIT